MTKFKEGDRVEFIPDAEGELDSAQYSYIPHLEGRKGIVTENQAVTGYIQVKWDRNVVFQVNEKDYYSNQMCFKERSLKLVEPPVDNFEESQEE